MLAAASSRESAHTEVLLPPEHQHTLLQSWEILWPGVYKSHHPNPQLKVSLGPSLYLPAWIFAGLTIFLNPHFGKALSEHEYYLEILKLLKPRSTEIHRVFAHLESLMWITKTLDEQNKTRFCVFAHLMKSFGWIHKILLTFIFFLKHKTDTLTMNGKNHSKTKILTSVYETEIQMINEATHIQRSSGNKSWNLQHINKPDDVKKAPGMSHFLNKNPSNTMGKTTRRRLQIKLINRKINQPRHYKTLSPSKLHY